MSATPTIKPKVQPYLTIVEGRRPEQKTHTSIGHAKNSLVAHASNQGTLWEWRDGEWSLLYTVTSERLESWRWPYWDQTVPWREERS